MDEDVMSINTGILRRIIEKVINKLIKKNVGLDPRIKIKQLEFHNSENGRSIIDISISACMSMKDVEKLIDEKLIESKQ